MGKKHKKMKLDQSETTDIDKTEETEIKTDKTNEKQPSDWKVWRKEKKRLHRERKEQKLVLAAKKQKEIKVENDEKECQSNKIKKEVENFYTVSIALPGSILDNAQSPELRTYLGGQIARAAGIFRVNEIIIFDETSSATSSEKTTEGEYTGVGKTGQANVQLARILQYLECPQYLRKYFFPMHKDLEYAGLLNPLDAPHHLRTDDNCEYREGVVSNHPVGENQGSLVQIGLRKEVEIDKVLIPGIRVTVKLDQKHSKKLKGIAVSPTAPHSEGGIYWGYSVRLATTFGDVFKECPYKEGYDLIIGTSEHGDNVADLQFRKSEHILIVFGGLKGLEYCLDSDQNLESNDLRELFHYYINACPNQGSRTIRTEEAILIALATLRPKFSCNNETNKPKTTKK